MWSVHEREFLFRYIFIFLNQIFHLVMFSLTDSSSPSSPYPVTNNSKEQVLKGLMFHFV